MKTAIKEKSTTSKTSTLKNVPSLTREIHSENKTKGEISDKTLQAIIFGVIMYKVD